LKEFSAKEKLEIVLSAPVPAFTFSVSVGQARRGGRKGEIPPSEPTQFGLDISEQDTRPSALHPYKFPLIPLKMPLRSKKSFDLRRGFFIVSQNEPAC
jgi:hypothetical protein